MTEKIKVESCYTPDKDAQDELIGSMDIKLPGTLRIEGEPGEGQAVEFRVSWIEGVGVRPVGIAVLSLNGQEVTSTDLRAVRAKDLWRAAIVDHVRYMRMFTFEWEKSENVMAVLDSPIQFPDDKLERIRLNGPVHSTLEYVVDLYTFADTIGLPPVQYIQQIFAGENLEPLPRTTATKWVKRAKDLGLFEEWFNGDD